MPKHIKLKKTGTPPNPGVPTPAWEGYNLGQDNPDSLPLGYELTGVLLGTIEVGEPLRILRQTRNGVKCPGEFVSSPVTGIDGDKIWTRNSIYTILEATDLQFALASQDGVEKHASELGEFLALIGLEEALVTDESSLWDFQLDAATYRKLCMALGRTVTPETRVVEVLQTLRNRRN